MSIIFVTVFPQMCQLVSTRRGPVTGAGEIKGLSFIILGGIRNLWLRDHLKYLTF